MLSPTRRSRQSGGFLEPQVPSQLDIDFIDLIESLEEELARARHIRNPRDHRDRAILVGVTTGSAASAQESLEELRELARSAEVAALRLSASRAIRNWLNSIAEEAELATSHVLLSLTPTGPAPGPPPPCGVEKVLCRFE